MGNYLHRQQTHIPNQREPDDGATHKNPAGGYVYQTDKWTFARRFLVLGSEGGTYYTKERELTKANTDNLQACIKEDGVKLVDLIVEMRDRAPKRDTIMYALALAFAQGDKHTPDNDNSVKDKVHEIFQDVVRTGSDLLLFVSFIDNMRGWGTSLRRLISNWYLNLHEKDRLAYQVLKYQDRHGWTHRRVLKVCHLSDVNNGLLRWVLKLDTDERDVLRRETGLTQRYPQTDAPPELILGYESIKKATTKRGVLQLIGTHRFTHEMVPNEWKNEPEVWDKLLENMPLIAMTRNLGKMSNVGLITPLSQASVHVINQLSEENIKRSKVHPIQMLMARLTYANGRGVRGSLSWEPDTNIVEALEAGFYHAFENVEPINKKVLIAIDVSGSMSWGDIAGCPNLTPDMAAACMAMVFARKEPIYHVIGFAHKLVELNITKNDSLNSVCKEVKKGGGGTDCALPMLYADSKNLDVEGIIMLTDNVTWYGSVHPTRAFNNYISKRSGQAGGYKKGSPSHESKLKAANAKLAVISMTATDETITQSNNASMLDVVGFDTATPQLVNDFIRD